MQQNNSYRTITREQFLFHEMRITAKLMTSGMSDKESIENIYNNSLFQFPTERMIRNIANVCLTRLHSLESATAVELIAEGSISSAKQTCLYAIILSNQLIFDFMSTVIAEKYRTKDFHYSRRDLNSFFTRLQELWDLLDEHPIFPSEGYRTEIRNDLKNIFREVSKNRRSYRFQKGILRYEKGRRINNYDNITEIWW